MIIVSACLAGVNCRYDGGNSALKRVREMVSSRSALPLCPEQLGGLPTPRPPAEIRGGDGADVLAGRAGVLNSAGHDVTAGYLDGSREALKIAGLVSAREAVLKERSPACGVRFICREGKPVKGAGVFAAMLAENGIRVRSSGEI